MIRAIEFIRDYWQHLPLAVPAIADLRCQVVRLEGRAKSGESIDVVYAGRQRNFAYLTKAIFEDSQVRDRKLTSVFGYKDAAAPWLEHSDLLLVDIGWPYNKRINRAGAYIEIPDWIEMAVDIDGDWDSLTRRFRRDVRKNDLRRIRRQGYTQKVTSAKAELKRFYDEVYAPYIRFVHGADANLAARWFVVQQGSKGALIKVMKDDGLAAAGVVLPAGDVLTSLWMGVPEARLTDRPEAAISALYKFFLEYAIEKGFKSADFAGTRAFLNDGALRFKRKWGGAVHDGFSPSSILLRPLNSKPQTLALLMDLPTIIRGTAGLESLILSSGDDASEEAVRATVARHETAGLGRRNVVVVSEAAGSGRSIVHESRDGTRIMYVAPELVPECYSDRWLESSASELRRPSQPSLEARHSV